MEDQISHLSSSTGLLILSTSTESTANSALNADSNTPNLKSLTKESDDGNDSRIESLPPEIRRHLLITLDLPELDALVHASPIFHQQFIIDRQFILSRIFKGPLCSVINLAYTVHQTAADPRKDPESVSQFLVQHFPSRNPPPPSNLSVKECYSMINYYSSIIEPTVRYYASWLFAYLAGETGENSVTERSATDAEVLRLTRAIYLYQILSHVSYAEPPWEPIDEFLRLLEPWECEQVLAIYQFADIMFEEGFQKMSTFNDMFGSESSVEVGSLRGLAILHPIIFNSEDKEQLAAMLTHVKVSWAALSNIQDNFGKKLQARRLQFDLHELNEVQESEESLVHVSGGVTDSPPSAWMEIWRNKRGNLYGWHTSDHMRRWGYVFWDLETLETVGGREVLQRQWEDRQAGKGKLRSVNSCVIS